MAYRASLSRAISSAKEAAQMGWDGGEVLMVCPCCGSSYQHSGTPNEIDGADNYRASWGGRGDLVMVPFRGECGSAWDVCFGFHKGDTAAFVRIRKDCRHPEVEASTGGDAL